MSIGRVALGVQAIVMPRLVSAVWLGRHGRGPAGRLLMRAVGARDLGIGIGVLAGQRSGGPLRAWLVAGIVADAVDFAATLSERDDLPASADLVLPMAAGGAALGLYALTGVDGSSGGRAPVPA